MYKLNPERQLLAKSYANTLKWVERINVGFFLLYTFTWILFGVADKINRFSSGYSPHENDLVLDFIIYYSIYLLSWFPISLFIDRWISRKYGMAVNGVVIWALWYFLKSAYSLGKYLILILAIFGCVNVLLAGRLPIAWLMVWPFIHSYMSPSVLIRFYVKAFIASKPLQKSMVDLETKIRDFLIQINFPVEKILVYRSDRDDFDANAFAFPKRKPEIYLGANVIGKFTTEEILTILAHEVGHLRDNRFSKPRTLFFTWIYPLISLSILIAILFLFSKAFIPQATGVSVSWFPVAMIIMWLYSYVSFGLLYYFYMGDGEFSADDFALTIIDPETYVSTLLKLADVNLYFFAPSKRSVLNYYPSFYERILRIQRKYPNKIVVGEIV
jgi:Zn-dependent protease with chaperone function